MPFSGQLVTFEGGEGSGKSSQLEAIAERALRRDYEVVTCREPGGTELGERLREVLFSGEHPHPLAELMIFGAARAQLVHEVIQPALGRGALVLCDRFTDSTIAYQHFGRDIDMGLVTTVAYAAATGVWPDLSILMDLDPMEGLRRAGEASDYIEAANIQFHGRVHEGYRLIARQEPERWLVVDAARPPSDLTDEIWTRVEALLAEVSPD